MIYDGRDTQRLRLLNYSFVIFEISLIKRRYWQLYNLFDYFFRHITCELENEVQLVINTIAVKKSINDIYPDTNEEFFPVCNHRQEKIVLIQQVVWLSDESIRMLDFMNAPSYPAPPGQLLFSTEDDWQAKLKINNWWMTAKSLTHSVGFSGILLKRLFRWTYIGFSGTWNSKIFNNESKYLVPLIHFKTGNVLLNVWKT